MSLRTDLSCSSEELPTTKLRLSQRWKGAVQIMQPSSDISLMFEDGVTCIAFVDGRTCYRHMQFCA